MVNSLYGRPQLVIGIERGGTAVAAAFAKGADARSCVLIRQPRPTSEGWRGSVRTIIQAVSPLALRTLYRKIFFKAIVRTSNQVGRQALELAPAAREKLDAALGAQSDGIVFVVDDAIDSGGTASRVLAGLSDLAPRARIVLFSLTSTVGIRVADLQINAFTDILEYHEGDISDLAASYSESAEWRGPVEDPSIQRATAAVGRTLYLDLDGTLVMDSFRCAQHTLLRFLVSRLLPRPATRLFLNSIAKKLRLINHQALKMLIDELILDLTPEQNEAFQALLSTSLASDSRWTLTAIARAPNVRSRIVTAALASYTEAIERALGIPVLIASGRNPDGVWMEVDSEAKVAAIRADRKQADQLDVPSLFVGDTIADALASTDGVHITILPKWDATGLLTVLASDSWWRAP